MYEKHNIIFFNIFIISTFDYADLSYHAMIFKHLVKCSWVKPVIGSILGGESGSYPLHLINYSVRSEHLVCARWQTLTKWLCNKYSFISLRVTLVGEAGWIFFFLISRSLSERCLFVTDFPAVDRDQYGSLIIHWNQSTCYLYSAPCRPAIPSRW